MSAVETYSPHESFNWNSLKTYRQCRRLRRIFHPKLGKMPLKTYRQCRRLRPQKVRVMKKVFLWRPIANVGGWDYIENKYAMIISEDLSPMSAVETFGGKLWIIFAPMCSEDLSPMSAVETAATRCLPHPYSEDLSPMSAVETITDFQSSFYSLWRPIANVGGWD